MIVHESAKTVAIATGFKTRSTNRKTGNMIQIWILSRDIDPVQSVKTGHDSTTVCKGCPFASGNGCYVNVGQAPLSIWRAYKRGAYSRLEPKDYGSAFNGRKVRFGAYGNPSLLPISIVEAIANASSGWTGYFHDWREMAPALAKAYGRYFMASTETNASRYKAEKLGLRSFHVSPKKPQGYIECLSDSAGITCEKCNLCSGLSKARLQSVWINPHGSGKRKAIKMSLN